MNEKINGLWDKAVTSVEQEPDGDWSLDTIKDKFAELIVAECVNALETEVDSWKEMDPYRGSIKRLGTKAIKQHFGVEE